MSSAVFTKLTTLLPIRDHELYDLYQTAMRTFWTPDEVDLTEDVSQWNNSLSGNERIFLSHVLGFFVQADQLVNINLSERFLKDIEGIPTKYSAYARLFYNAQMMIEDVHTLSYETMLNEFLTDAVENAHFKQSIANIPCITYKAAWAARYIDDTTSTFPVRLIAFAILEGIFFSGSFASIFWIEQTNRMRGIVAFNKLISRDENLHYQFALMLFRKLRDDPEVSFDVRPETIVQMIEDAVAIETEFINVSIPCDMIGMNKTLMSQYIKYVADHLLIDIQMEPIYKAENPFSFMVALGVPDRSNFFEQRETVYSKPIESGVAYDSDASDF